MVHANTSSSETVFSIYATDAHTTAGQSLWRLWVVIRLHPDSRPVCQGRQPGSFFALLCMVGVIRFMSKVDQSDVLMSPTLVLFTCPHVDNTFLFTRQSIYGSRPRPSMDTSPDENLSREL